ncbi:acyloxyacyl hydrolase [Ramlibacter sp. AN1015]|uniref:acyloxyacyl hydrolase n=1 Tax=Ramlibacter sp. AN1015 TaxID=3133428 RepID=UPI0030C5ABE5
MTSVSLFARSMAGVLLAGTLLSARAIDFTPDAVSVQAGAGRAGVDTVGVGVIWDWKFQQLRRKAELTAHTELMVSGWRADDVGGGNQRLVQVVLLPSLRMRLARGESPWFIEFGIGASYLGKDYITPDKAFSTRWNFYDMLGIGHSFGEKREHELGLRLVHVSNAGIRKPNPGEDFLHLRYVRRF